MFMTSDTYVAHSFTESRGGDGWGSEVVSTEREEMQQQQNMNDDAMFMQMQSAVVHLCLYFGMPQNVTWQTWTAFRGSLHCCCCSMEIETLLLKVWNKGEAKISKTGSQFNLIFAHSYILQVARFVRMTYHWPRP